METTQKDM